MKKNLRIVSAAAAALLAVAPVAASAVSANAAVTVNGDNSSANTPAQTAGTVTVNVAIDATAGKTSVEDAQKSAKVTVDGASVANTSTDKYNVVIQDANGGTVSGNLEAGKSYRVVISNLKLQNLTTGKTYTIAGGTVDTTTKTTASATKLMDGSVFTSDTFTLFDKSLTGNPIFTEGNKYVSNGSISLPKDAKTAKVSEIANEITTNYKLAKSNNNDSAKPVALENSDVETAIKNALTNAKISLDKDGDTFNVPAANFTVELTGYANNGNKVSFPVTVKVPKQAPAASVAPVFDVVASAKDNYTKNSANNYTRKNSLELNSSVNAESIAKDFTATINGNSGVNAQVNVKSSNLNTAVAGKYTVVLTATNPAGKTTDVTVNVTVGNPGETKTVQAGSETATVVTINGNNVTATNTTLANGAKVATFKTVVINGVSYTQLNSENSNQYVETKYVDGSIKEETTKSAKVMYKSAVYDKDGKSTGKTIGGYTDKDFVTTSNGDLKVVEIKGGNFYQLAKGEGYVRVRNVTGSKMTLKHNAYVYKSNGKRANKKVYKKGSTVTVYGGQYKAIKKYKGKAVRIGVNRYIKTANVNYKLAK